MKYITSNSSTINWVSIACLHESLLRLQPITATKTKPSCDGCLLYKDDRCTLKEGYTCLQ